MLLLLFVLLVMSRAATAGVASAGVISTFASLDDAAAADWSVLVLVLLLLLLLLLLALLLLMLMLMLLCRSTRVVQLPPHVMLRM